MWKLHTYAGILQTVIFYGYLNVLLPIYVWYLLAKKYLFPNIPTDI